MPWYARWLVVHPAVLRPASFKGKETKAGACRRPTLHQPNQFKFRDQTCLLCGAADFKFYGGIAKRAFFSGEPRRPQSIRPLKWINVPNNNGSGVERKITRQDKHLTVPQSLVRGMWGLCEPREIHNLTHQQHSTL